MFSFHQNTCLLQSRSPMLSKAFLSSNYSKFDLIMPIRFYRFSFIYYYVPRYVQQVTRNLDVFSPQIFHIYSHLILWTEIVSVEENVQITRKYITFSVTIKEGCVKFQPNMGANFFSLAMLVVLVTCDSLLLFNGQREKLATLQLYQLKSLYYVHTYSAAFMLGTLRPFFSKKKYFCSTIQNIWPLYFIQLWGLKSIHFTIIH